MQITTQEMFHLTALMLRSLNNPCIRMTLVQAGKVLIRLRSKQTKHFALGFLIVISQLRSQLPDDGRYAVSCYASDARG